MSCSDYYRRGRRNNIRNNIYKILGPTKSIMNLLIMTTTNLTEDFVGPENRRTTKNNRKLQDKHYDLASEKGGIFT